jgi:hypothetical protein
MVNTPRRKRLSALLGTAALVGLVGAPMQASAFSVDVAGNNILTDDGGDTLIFPFYSASTQLNNNLGAVTGARSSFSVTNTSETAAVAVKVRFREQINSEEIFDFIVFLSPRDKFDFAVRQNSDANGDPTEPPRIYFARNRNADDSLNIELSETSCIAPLGLYNYDLNPSGAANLFRKPQFTDLSGVELWRSMAVGHVEIISMANLTNATYTSAGQPVPLGPAITHAFPAGIPGNCNAAVQAFSSAQFVNTIQGATDAGNDLIGRMLVTIPEAGIEAGTNAQSLKNTFTAPQLVPQDDALCAQTVTCVSNYAWDTEEHSHPHLGDVGANGDSIADQLEARALQNDWSRTAATDVNVDWIVSFPTKYVYQNFTNCDGAPGSEWCNVAPWGGQGADDPWGSFGEPASCLDTELQVWDWDEFENSLTSPSAPEDLCNEVNVLTIREEFAPTAQSMIQYDPARSEYVFENLYERERGWADLELLWNPIGYLGPDNYGAAVFGLAFTVRATGDPNINNGSLTDLSRRVNNL